jgi:hypothetical protein
MLKKTTFLAVINEMILALKSFFQAYLKKILMRECDMSFLD